MPGLNQVSSGLNAVISDIRGTRFTDVVMAAATATQSEQLPEGIYEVWSTADCYMRDETGAAGTTLANGLILRANNNVRIRIERDHRIGLFSTPGGTFSGFKVS